MPWFLKKENILWDIRNKTGSLESNKMCIRDRVVPKYEKHNAYGWLSRTRDTEIYNPPQSPASLPPIPVSYTHLVVQVAFNVPFSGPNGLGGITVDGNASNYKVKTDKKGNIRCV